MIDNPQKILGDDKLNSEENLNQEQGVNAKVLDDKVKTNDINTIGISTTTLEEVHKRELASRQQTVQIEQENAIQMNI